MATSIVSAPAAARDVRWTIPLALLLLICVAVALRPAIEQWRSADDPEPAASPERASSFEVRTADVAAKQVTFRPDAAGRSELNFAAVKAALGRDPAAGDTLILQSVAGSR